MIGSVEGESCPWQRSTRNQGRENRAVMMEDWVNLAAGVDGLGVYEKL